MTEQTPFDIKAVVVESVSELFDTMLSMAVQYTEEVPAALSEARRLIGSLSFAGEVLGVINFQVTEPFARTVAASMLGMEPEEIESDEEVKDVIREACNIVGGNLKSSLNDAGLTCVISTPSITIGRDFIVETLNMDRYERFAFLCGEDTAVVELCVKAAEKAPAETKLVLKSIDLNKFQRLDIISSIGDSVIELFDTMLDMEVELAGDSDFSLADTLRMVAHINFAGGVKGSINLQLSEAFGRVVTAKILGVSADEVQDEEQIKDAVGEACNIIAGNLKTGFCDTGLGCRISPPTITSGRNFTIETLHVDRHERFAFHYLDHPIMVEVAVKIDEAALAALAPAEKAEPQPADPADMQAAVDAMMKGAAQQAPDPSLQAAQQPSEAAAKGQAADAAEPRETAGKPTITEDKLNFIFDIPLEITVELGRTRIKIDELLKLGPGSAITLSNLEGEPLDLLVNDQLIARGEVVVEKEKYGIRITEVVASRERLKSLR